ncbi:MAG: cytochrome c family protein [Alphaproteobacteria bacterium CG_4_10_14_0_8_um_filter_37_21]|nr:MAG: cytochrome c family protein [Alphaproteobacteria bacterium CG_4_10_14_0_8_um_filter_37_21]
MDSFTWNKIIAGVLCALLIIKIGDITSQQIIHVEKLSKPSFIIDVAEVQTSSDDIQPTGPADITPLLINANIANGEKLFKKCMQCHTPNKSGMHKVGPNLWNIVMQDYAIQDGYAYSSALTNLKGQKKWTTDNLNKFLYKPTQFIKGTKMLFVGLKKDQDRADIIAYLNQQSDSPVKLP